MKVTLGIAIAAALLALGFLIWGTGSLERVSIAPRLPALEQTQAASENASLQQPELAPGAEPSTPASARAAVLLPDGKPALAPAMKVVTLLRVHVLAKEDMTPLQDRLLTLHDRSAFDPTGGKLVRAPRGRVGGSRSTDADGMATIAVEPGSEYSIRVVGLDWDTEEHIVAPLAPGEQRELELLVTTRDPSADDLTFFGVLLDAENSMPVMRGVLQVEGDLTTSYSDVSGTYLDFNLEGPPIRADFDGQFKILDKASRRRSVTVTAPGYARTMFELDSQHSNPQSPLEIRMSRSAAVEATVMDALGAPIADATVELTNEAGPLSRPYSLGEYSNTLDPHWSAKTDALGFARVIDLPTGIPLKLIVSKPGFAAREETERIRLSPGERRRVEVSCGTGGVVRGLLLDGAGSPVAGHRIWRMRSETTTLLPMLFRSSNKPAAATRTDEAGRFQFAEVPLGIWYVGVAPELEILGEKSGLPGYAQALELSSAGEVVEIVLQMDAGLYLRGSVIDQNGDPVRSCKIEGLLENTSIAENDTTDGAGNFALGPLMKGTWLLELPELAEMHTPPVQTRVQAGAQGVVIRVNVGASIAGRVVDRASLAPSRSSVTLARTDGARIGQWMNESYGDSFRFSGLLPGTYVITARGDNGAVGVSNPITITEGEALQSVEVLLGQGAKIRMRYDGEAQLGLYMIFSGGMLIGANAVGKGHVNEESVPAGSVEVHWSDRDSQITKTESVTIGAGEMRELVWDGKP